MHTGLANNTEARLSELPSAYGNDVKTMPGTMSSTKRNSMAHNILNAEKSSGAPHGSGIKHQEKRSGAARNTTANDTLRPNKNQSRHKRKAVAGAAVAANNLGVTGGLSSTHNHLSDSTSNFGVKMRTKST